MDKPPFESLNQMAETTAAALSQAAASHAFHLFRDKNFRRLAQFDRISQTEQDRIFNELIVAYLVLIMLMCEAPDLKVSVEFRDCIMGLKKRVPQAYVDNLRDLGVEAKHLREWEKLIGMRHEEYATDRHDVRAAAMQIKSSEGTLNLDSLSKIQVLVPVHSAAIGCHHHICRGETAGKDALFKLILTSLAKFYFKIRMKIEGGKISPLKRARAALKVALDRMDRKEKGSS